MLESLKHFGDWLSVLAIIFGALGIVGVAISYLITIFGRVFKDKQAASDKADDRLIGLLKNTVEELERNQQDNMRKIDELSTKVDALEKSNQMMTDIFQGRDQSTQDFQLQGFEAMKKAQQILETVNTTNRNVEKLYGVIAQYLKTINVAIAPDDGK